MSQPHAVPIEDTQMRPLSGIGARARSGHLQREPSRRPSRPGCLLVTFFICAFTGIAALFLLILEHETIA